MIRTWIYSFETGRYGPEVRRPYAEVRGLVDQLLVNALEGRYVAHHMSETGIDTALDLKMCSEGLQFGGIVLNQLIPEELDELLEMIKVYKELL